MPQQGKYLSTDPNAGLSSSKYLSTDPNAGQAAATAPKAAQPSTYQKLTASYDPEVEAWAAKHPVLGPAARFFDAAGGAVMASPQQAYEGIRHPIESIKSLGSSLNAYNPWNPEHITARGALSVLPEALGSGVGNVATGEAVKMIPKVTQDARSAVATKLYDAQTGKLRPRLQEATSLFGVGGPVRAGIKTLFPEPEEQVMGRVQGQALNENAKITARTARKPLRGNPTPFGPHDTESAAGTRSLVLTPEEATTETRMQGIAKKRASERGMQFAAGMTPREGRSVPRYPFRTPITEYPGPREVTTFGEQGRMPEISGQASGRFPQISSETPNPTGPPLTIESLRRMTNELHPETAEEVARRRYMTAQIRHHRNNP